MSDNKPKVEDCPKSEETALGLYESPKKIIVRNMGIKTISLTVKNLQWTRTLCLRENRLTSVPEEIGQLPNLIILDLSENLLTFLPETIRNLSKLEKLLVADNFLTDLPKGIGSLYNLEELFIGRNEIKEIPAEIGGLSNLERFVADGNKLSCLPSEIGFLTKVRMFDVSNNRLTSIPDEITNIKYMTKLLLSGNRLRRLPDKMNKFRQLADLYVNENELIYLPSSMAKLNGLRLNISDNRLKSVMPVIKMSKINYLLISSNPPMNYFPRNNRYTDQKKFKKYVGVPPLVQTVCWECGKDHLTESAHGLLVDKTTEIWACLECHDKHYVYDLGEERYIRQNYKENHLLCVECGETFLEKPVFVGNHKECELMNLHESCRKKKYVYCDSPACHWHKKDYLFLARQDKNKDYFLGIKCLCSSCDAYVDMMNIRIKLEDNVSVNMKICKHCAFEKFEPYITSNGESYWKPKEELIITKEDISRKKMCFNCNKREGIPVCQFQNGSYSFKTACETCIENYYSKVRELNPDYAWYSRIEKRDTSASFLSLSHVDVDDSIKCSFCRKCPEGDYVIQTAYTNSKALIQEIVCQDCSRKETERKERKSKKRLRCVSSTGEHRFKPHDFYLYCSSCGDTKSLPKVNDSTGNET